ncbi:MAG: hypothetical protein ACK41T_05620 [Pseudobdellovibrio sp.]
MSIDKEILNDFYEESKGLIEELVDLLESMEGDFSQIERLCEYGNKIDRIMGTARSIALMAPPDHGLNLISDYTSLCKVVAYKAAEVKSNPKLYEVTVALLLDATEALEVLIPKLELPMDELKKCISPNFIERVRWVSGQFIKQTEAPQIASTTGSNPMGQADIDDLMKKLGF